MARPVEATIPFASLADELLTSFYDANPVEALRRGLFRYAGRLPDVSRGGLERRAEELERSLERLDGIDPTSLSLREAFDRKCLRLRWQMGLFRLREWDVFARYPLTYLDLLDVSDYVKPWVAPRPDRTMALCLLLEGVPRVLDDARENLDSSLDRTVGSAASRLFEGYANFLESDLEQFLAEDANRENLPLLQARRQAIEAVQEFLAFLEERIAPASADVFPIGSESFRKMLRYGEGVDLDPSELLDQGERELERIRDELHRAVDSIDPSSSPAEVMARVKANHPSGRGAVEESRRLVQELREFLLERDLVTIPSDTECLVRETPPYLRWAFAMMDGPPSLADREFPGIYYVTPPHAEWDEDRTEQWLREFSYAGLKNTAIHEAFPGHFLHALHIRQNPSPIVRTHSTYSSFEAWAHYCEEMMVEEGYGGGDPELKTVQLSDALLRVVRLIVAVRMHTLGMTVDEAQEMFEGEAFLEEVAARSEAERGTFDPGYANYTLGKMMLRKLRNDWRAAQGEAFSLKAFHDSFLAWGAAPVPFVREEMLPGDRGAIL
jgi:uncharacterized protein (DUF885 family)